MDTKILMVVKEAEARAAYEDALQKVGVDYDIAASFNEVLSMSIDNVYSGLMIDILTLVRSSKEEKVIAYDCINLYPSLRVKWDPKRQNMSLSPMEQSFPSDTGGTLAYFIESRCKSFTARSLRRFIRKDAYLGALLASGSHFTVSGSAKTFTVNISQGGAFVHTTEPFAKGEPVWVRFIEMPDTEPLQASVCRHIEWGTGRSIPGIGVRFDTLSKTQSSEIIRLVKSSGRRSD
jgi:hypothetical protein